jgi:hypothetical protein
VIPYPTLSNIQTADVVLKGERLPKPDTMPDEIYQLCLAGILFFLSSLLFLTLH